tara:strand:+ start:10706 stop:11302 length:597 start_codon:yes stop_codon:yes gene_type:complete
MSYIGTQPNDVKKNTGLYTPSEILQLTKDGSWGGSLELIEEQTFSSSSGVDFTSIQENKYDVHLLQYNIDLSSYRQLYLRFYESGVLETASVYQYGQQFGSTSGSFSEQKSTGATQIFLNFTNQHQNQGYIYLYNLGNSSKYSYTTHHSFVDDSGNSRFFFEFGGGVLPQTSTVDGIRFFPQADTFDGSAKLYGVKKI